MERARPAKGLGGPKRPMVACAPAMSDGIADLAAGRRHRLRIRRWRILGAYRLKKEDNVDPADVVAAASGFAGAGCGAAGAGGGSSRFERFEE